MKVVLELQDQPSNIKKVTVRHDIVIGRGADCNLRLSAPQVSRRHCFLRISGEGAFVSDLDSSNGTFMNGTKLTSGKRYELQDGTILSVGPVKFIARVQSDVLAAEVLQVSVADERIEAEAPTALDDSAAEVDFEATIANSSRDALDLAVEQAGPAADEDEPTADYVASPIGDSDYFSDVEDDDLTGAYSTEDEGDPATVVDASEVEEQLDVIAVDDEEVLVLDQEDSVTVKEPVKESKSELSDDESELRDFLKDLD